MGHCSVIYTAEAVEPVIVRRRLFYRMLFTLKLAVLHRTLKITSLIYYLCKHSQRPQKLTYSYTLIFWLSCDQPMPRPFPFPSLRKGPGIEVELCLAIVEYEFVPKFDELCANLFQYISRLGFLI